MISQCPKAAAECMRKEKGGKREKRVWRCGGWEINLLKNVRSLNVIDQLCS